MTSGHSRMIVLDPQTFAASTLADSEGLAAALRILESCLAGPSEPLDLIIQDLCSVPNLFEFMISTLPSGRELMSRIINAYPTNPMLVKASYTSALLPRLLSVISALPPYLFSTLTVRQIGQYKFYAENALPVLTLLYSTDFSTGVFTNVTPTAIPEDPEYNSNGSSGLSTRPKKQKKIKGKNEDGAHTIDLTPFQKLGTKVPSTHAETTETVRGISNNLKMILKFCLELLFEPSVAQQFKDTYTSTINDPNVGPAALPKEKAIEVVESERSAYPKVQPIKAALYFENPDSFGEWRIIISTNATKKLQELAGGDRETCVIVVKKIRQLSKGYFSAENQKRLNGPSGVPIFEVKMKDLRLVYQVDVVPDYDGYVERQVIKIYGIYTHPPLNRIWDAIGQYLACKGEEYYRRCIFRNRPVHPGGNVYLPACFPPNSVENETKPTPLELFDEELGELHSLLVLYKYITFSQAFLHSLIANQDVQHVFELTPQERRIIECETSCYVLGRGGTGKTTTMLFKMLGIERAWQMLGSDILKPRQIFVTKSDRLAEKVEEYFTKLLESLALAGYSLKDLKARRTDLSGPEVRVPTKYSLLEDNHFPLFMTFDKLAQMIAADVLSSDNPEVQRDAKIFINTNETEAEDSFVSYDIFSRTYWPHLPQSLSKGLEPWLVFSEFMGVIKGSEKALTCPGGFLDEATYCGLSDRTNPTFANHKKPLYALFKAYSKLKKERRHHDVADRTHAILKALLGGTPLEGRRVDYLYVDEAQDNLLIDALLLRLICRNPEGLFWAGDTAQTISAGSSFRFDDLKAYLYRIERDRSMDLIRDRSVVSPSVFQLAINYRSHGGIINCARTVIERIMHFWPDAIDRLKPEHGIVDGLKPMFFRQDTNQYEQFLFGESGNRIELGAEQCILVRDKKAREKLQQDIGAEVGLVMTLYDSKGLEFNDVLLYNFFEASAVDVLGWSVLLNDTEGEVDGKDLAKVYAPSFGRDEGRFAGVCSELKLLYVGITRARKNLWIVDKSDKSEPMRMIWTSRNQLQNYTPGMDFPHLAVSSTNTEWESFGRNLLKHEKYLEAVPCFTKASLPRMAEICNAFHLRELARAKVGVEPRKVQQDAFLAAANALLTATDAFRTSKNDAPSARDKFKFYRNAAECYDRGGDSRKAAVVYLSVEEYEFGARCFRKAGRFDETLEVLHEHSRKISSDCYKELLTVCRLFYCSKRGRKRPRFPLFSSLEEEEKFLKDYELDFSRAELLAFYGKYLEAAKVHLLDNRPLDAIRDFLKEGSLGAIRKATKILLDGLWCRCSFATTHKAITADQDIARLLNLGRELPVDLIDPLDYREISMFQAIVQADFRGLEELSNEFIKENKKAAALLSLDHYFGLLPKSKSYEIREMSLFLSKFMEYTRLLHFIISHTDPLCVDSIVRLFCIRQESLTKYGLGIGSFLHSSARVEHSYSKKSVIVLSKNDVVSVLRKYLAEYLRERVLEENEVCPKAPRCPYTVTDQCDRVNCPQEHVTPEDSKRYDSRLGVYLQQLNILQLMLSVNPCYPLFRSQAITLDWLSRLYDAFNSQSHVLTIPDLSLMSGARNDIPIMKNWVRDALDNLHRDFLTTVLRLTSLFFSFDKSSALSCIKRAYCNLPRIRIPQSTHPDDEYAIEDIDKLFDGTHHICISAVLNFLRHVVKSSQVTHLSVFCECLEEVIGKISVSSQFSELDGLVLPRGWLSFIKDFSSKTEIPIALIEIILDCAQDLLVRLQSDATSGTPTHLETDVHLKTKLTPALCDIFMSRICRALCFLTYNVRNSDIEQKIGDIFNALRTTGLMQPAHQRYVEADSSSDYLKLVIAYYIEAKENLVQLHHKGSHPHPVSPLRLPGIKHITFTDPFEIPYRLSSRPVPTTHSEPRANALASVQDVLQIEKAGDEHKARLEGPNVEPEPQEIVQATDELALIHEQEQTEQGISAARRIQVAYRRYRRCEALARALREGLKAQKIIVFVKCLKNVYASNWGRTPYRTLYLWALPRLVVCLDKVVAIALEFKKKTTGQLLHEHHERLELAMQINHINALLNKGYLLQKRIEPNATMHQAPNRRKAEMKQAVLDIKDIIHRLPVEAPEIQDDFDFAYKLVMFEE